MWIVETCKQVISILGMREFHEGKKYGTVSLLSLPRFIVSQTGNGSQLHLCRFSLLRTYLNVFVIVYLLVCFRRSPGQIWTCGCCLYFTLSTADGDVLEACNPLLPPQRE